MPCSTRALLSLRSLRAGAFVLLTVALAGCGGGSQSLPTPGAHPDSAIAVSREQNGRFLAFVGPKAQHDPPFLGVAGTNIEALRSWLDTRTGDIASQLYVEDSYAGPLREWNGAKDASGQNLRFIAIGHDEISCQGGCSYAEEFAAALPEPLLRASSGGLAVTFTSKSGTQMTLRVPGEQVVNQLAAIDSARKGLSLSAAPAAASPAPTAPPAASAVPPPSEPPLAEPVPAAPPPPASAAPQPGTPVPPPPVR
jgi:hypothetical protein